MMIEAVIWDFGGVLTSSPFQAFARFETERGLPTDIIRRTNANNHWENAWAKFERAEVDIEAFDHLFATESLALGAEVRGKDRPSQTRSSYLPVLQENNRGSIVA
jgi:putative hydrolase of the HAD superfamily